MSRWLTYLILIVVWSCGPDKAQIQRSTNIYYDINGLIDDQVKALDSISPLIDKKATIGNREEAVEFKPTDDSWSKELMIFRSADINKPTLSDSYDRLEITHPQSRTICYRSQRPASTEVDSLAISYKVDSLHPDQVYAFISHKNALFTSEKVLELLFLKEDDRARLSTYKINGWQKMISRDCTTYALDVRINYP